MSTLLRRPTDVNQMDSRGRFEKFNLEENPFPSDPFVNKDSTDKRVNGEIYEIEIRKPEYEKIEENFLRHPQSQPGAYVLLGGVEGFKKLLAMSLVPLCCPLPRAGRPPTRCGDGDTARVMTKC